MAGIVAINGIGFPHVTQVQVMFDEKNETLESLKQKIADQMHVTADKVQLIYAGHVLNNGFNPPETTLKDLGIFGSTNGLIGDLNNRTRRGRGLFFRIVNFVKDVNYDKAETKIGEAKTTIGQYGISLA